MFKFLLYSCFIYVQIKYSLFDKFDYFSEDFDSYKNCQNKKQFLSQLKTNKHHCISYPLKLTSNGNDAALKFELCQKDLSNKLMDACSGMRIKKTGILSYCTNRGNLDCCFSNYSCQKWENFLKHFGEEGDKYLNNRTHYLQYYLIKDVGYKSCYHLKNYDATSCSNDCKLFEKSNFSKNCSENGGVFKCCIRRDAVCDQCKFCCTLPMCTQKSKITTFDVVKNPNMISSSRNYKNSKEIYSTDTFLSTTDNRCLKPNSDKNSEKWKYYDMPMFRAAISKEELSKVPTYKFNKYFHNEYDRHSLKKFISSKGAQLMKKTYGFDYCAKIPLTNMGSYKCSIQCIKAETSKFAKDCKNKKGLFKCCLRTFILTHLEDFNIKNWLKMGLKKKPKRKCVSNNAKKDCFMCCVTYACTKWDKNKEKHITSFKTNLKPWQRAGGIREGIGQRYSFCAIQDHCNEFPGLEYYIPQQKYDEAISSKDICNLPTKQIFVSFNNTEQEDKYKELKKERKQKCLKDIDHSKFSNINVITCSRSNLKNKTKILKLANKILRKTIKKQKVKKYKKYKKYKKSKKWGKHKNHGKYKKDGKNKRKEKEHNGKRKIKKYKKSKNCGKIKNHGKC